MMTVGNSEVENAKMVKGAASNNDDAPALALIKASGLGHSFVGRSGIFKKSAIRAVQDVSFEIAEGETLGLVGESGCGKSTVGRIAVGLLPPGSGDVFIQGSALYSGKRRGSILKSAGLTGKLQMIFQDPHSSLNPRMRIGESVAEPLICLKVERPERDRRVAEILEMVGLSWDQGKRYPHEFSGGQRQRIAIARALVTRPFFVVCDEPTSSLDASVQAQILNLLKDMQEHFGLTFLFISHDLAVVRHVSDVTAVMYAGMIVESGPSEEIFTNPVHPYTRLLLSSVPGAPERSCAPPPNAGGASPVPDGKVMEGCPFAARCPLAMPVCWQELPALEPEFFGKAGSRMLRCRVRG